VAYVENLVLLFDLFKQRLPMLTHVSINVSVGLNFV
jgi:hypothetical protein